MDKSSRGSYLTFCRRTIKFQHKTYCSPVWCFALNNGAEIGKERLFFVPVVHKYMQIFDSGVCASFGNVQHTFLQLFDHFPPSHHKLDAYMHIDLTYNASCYFCKVTCSIDDLLDLSESSAHNQKLQIHNALYNSCVRLRTYYPM